MPIFLPPALIQAVRAIQIQAVHYEPEVVELAGTLIRKTFPGPPDFVFDKASRPERCWILKLDTPISVTPSTSSDDFNSDAFDQITEVQLVLTTDALIAHPRRIEGGKHLVLTGTLFESHTGHHHTQVLITVRSLRVVN
ncbi:MAG TPA: DUF4431 domain-containing protein [Holophagaceae bacterium]|nr:DUF4431 domain-containing protein [Holophagaceae bacterium]